MSMVLDLDIAYKYVQQNEGKDEHAASLLTKLLALIIQTVSV